MTNGIGYTHSMFSANLRKYAQAVDENKNSLIDGEEIKKFTELVKKETGITFSFNNIKQSSSKTINIKDANNSYLFNNAQELCSKYGKNGANSPSTLYLNHGDPFAKFSNKSAKIAYLSEDDFKASKAEVDKYENMVAKKIEAKAQKKAEQKQAAKQAPSFLDDPIGWLKDRWLRH